MKKPLFILLTMFFVIGACTSMQEGKALFEEKCGQCHALEKSLNISKDLAQWKKTTEAMVRYANGTISNKDAEIIANYLAKRKGD
jgi:mono/diheme cytochrome c family protein